MRPSVKFALGQKPPPTMIGSGRAVNSREVEESQAANRIVFTELADDDIDDIWLNIAADNEPVANRIVDELRAPHRVE